MAEIRLGRIGEQTPCQVLSTDRRGRAQFEAETDEWQKISLAIARALQAT